MAMPVLAYHSKTWSLTQKENQQIQAYEMIFLKRTKGCAIGNQIHNGDIWAELNNQDNKQISIP